MRYRVKEGYILVWVTVVMLGMMVLGLGMLQLGQAQGSQVVKEVWYSKALNLAEAGIERAVWKMKATPGWTGPWNNVALGDGTYTVTLAAVSANEWDVTSVGTVGNVSKSVTLRAKVQSGWPWTYDYALFWANPTNSAATLQVQNNSIVNGSTFAAGRISFSNNAQDINGSVYATGGVSGNGSYVVGQVPNPVPPKPTLDTSTYDAWISTAANVTPAQDNMPNYFTWSSGTWTLNNNQNRDFSAGGITTHYSKGNVSISNNFTIQNMGTLYVHGNLTLQNNATLQGPGRIVASGSITMQNNVHITGNVDLVAGGALSLQNNAASITGTGSVIYSPTSVTIGNNATIDKVVVISPGTVDISNNDSIHGVIWGGMVTLENNANVSGAVYGDMFTGNSIANNVHMNYDPSLFQYTPPPGIYSPPRTVPENWTEGTTTGF